MTDYRWTSYKFANTGCNNVQLDIVSGVIMRAVNPISKRANWGKRDYQLCFGRKGCLTRGGWTVTSSFFACCGPRFHHNWWLVACTALATQQMCCVIRRRRTLSYEDFRLNKQSESQSRDVFVHSAYLPFKAYATIFTLNEIFDTARIKLLLIFREIINYILRGTFLRRSSCCKVFKLKFVSVVSIMFHDRCLLLNFA